MQMNSDCYAHRNRGKNLFLILHNKPVNHLMDLPKECREEQRDLHRSIIALFILAAAILFIPGPSFSQISNENIKIGFLIRDKNDISMQQSAQLAIEHANASGGYMGQKFELITKSCDGAWGITSKQAVALIFEDQVPILVTALDGRNAHLAEQVIAKSHVVMLSTVSGDPTLSRAFVPWYFRMVPDDMQQAERLVAAIYLKNKAHKVAVISLDEYDGKKSVEALMKKINEQEFPAPEKFIGLSEQELLDQVAKNSWDAIVLAGSLSNESKIIDKIISESDTSKIFAFCNLFNFMNEYDAEIFSSLNFAVPIDLESSAWQSFENSYKNKYDKNPSPALAYVYDGIMLSIEAIRKFSCDSEAIRKGFKNLEYRGITGKVDFNQLGNREKFGK